LTLEAHLLASLADISSKEWNALAGPHPFLQHSFLYGLEQTGCVGEGTGWNPQYLVIKEAGKIKAAAPLYAKEHSYGEFVFDWAWARAYEQHGEPYYPKLLCAIPFSPISGPRLLVQDESWRPVVAETLMTLAPRLGCSGLHVLFPEENDRKALATQGALMRQGVQFHWHNVENEGYADFEAFLATLSHDKRKKIRQERRKVREAGVTMKRLRGKEISEEDWLFFARCYRNTYRQHGSQPYLNTAFFLHLGAMLPQHVLLVLAYRDGQPIAAALDIYDQGCLWGRHWGAIEHVPGLHFEACYYQGIEFCIEQRITIFEGGAQGEHKLARGFMPTTIWSAHQIADPRFAEAIAHFLEREGQGIAHYVSELEEHAPFRSSD